MVTGVILNINEAAVTANKSNKIIGEKKTSNHQIKIMMNV